MNVETEERMIENEFAKTIIFVHSSLDDAGLTPSEFRVYCHIARRAGKGTAFPSIESIAKTCKICEVTTKASLKELAARGMIRRTPRAGMTDLFTLTAPTEWHEAIREPPPKEGGGVVCTPPISGGGRGYTLGGGTPPISGGGKDIPLRKSPEGNPNVVRDAPNAPAGARTREPNREWTKLEEQVVEIWNACAKPVGMICVVEWGGERKKLFRARAAGKTNDEVLGIMRDVFIECCKTDWPIKTRQGIEHALRPANFQRYLDLSRAPKAPDSPLPGPGIGKSEPAHPKWKLDRIERARLNLQRERRAQRSLIAQGLNRDANAYSFDEADRKVAQALVELLAEGGTDE